jgi:hypothetical protein
MDSSVAELLGTWRSPSCPTDAAEPNKENKMTDLISWIAVFPEVILLLVMACAVLLVDLVKSRLRGTAPMC